MPGIQLAARSDDRMVRHWPIVFVFEGVCLLSWPSLCTQTEGKPSSGLITSQKITQDNFEPAVGEQIRRAYDAARRNPLDADEIGKLGMIFQVYGKYELAESCYRQALGLAPGSFRWVYYLGNVEGWLGKYRQAIDHIREAVTIDGKYTPARVRLAQLLFDSGDIDQSAKLFRESIDQNSRLATAHYGLGRVRAARGDWAGAIESYRRACEIAGDYAAAHYALGLAYRKAGSAAKAREHLERYELVKLSSQPSEDPLMDAVKSLYAGGLTDFAKGSALAQQGKLREAAVEFEAALKVNPGLVMAHVNLIAMYGQLSLPERAERHFRAAVELDPGWVEAYYNWGLFLVQQRRTAEAAEAFGKALELNPNYADAHAELGLLLDNAGRDQEAQRHYRLALENNPTHRQAHYLLGRSLIRTGPIDEAIAHLVSTIKVEDRKTPICMQALASAYEHAGNRAQALYYLREGRDRAVSLKMDELAAQLKRDSDRLSSGTELP